MSTSKPKTKIRVGVVRGGPSSEYKVSLETGGNVLKHLNSISGTGNHLKGLAEKYRAHDILITKDGKWHLDGFEKSPAEVMKHIDVAFNALHGEYGEDGKIQHEFETHGMPYTGSGTLGSALAMNKHLTKKVVMQNGIKTAIFKLVKQGENTPDKVMELFKTFPHPSVVKPVSAGSSVGVSVAYTYQDLEKALALALTHSPIALIEEYIAGREATAGVVAGLRDEKLYPLPPVEIVKPAKSPFFDYDAKYTGTSHEICPGNFSREEKEQLQAIAKQVHEVLGLDHYSRSDFIVSPRRGIYFLEVNTLPGLTNESLLPKSLEAVGVSMPEFIDHLISLALARK